MMASEIADECEALVAIYADTITVDHCDVLDARGARIGSRPSHVSVTVKRAAGDVCITFHVPAGYPDVLPGVEIEGLPRKQRDAFQPSLLAHMAPLKGSQMLFSCVEFVREHFGDDHAAAAAAAAADDDAAAAAAADAATAASATDACGDGGVSLLRIVHGPCVVFNKSVFQAHVAQVASVEEVRRVVDHLLTDPRVARATHNIMAYRILQPAVAKPPQGTGAGSTAAAADGPTAAAMKVIEDNDDDGEDAAGGRLAHVLALMKAENCVVVVSRWFGGVLLGPVRFKLINDTARELLEAQPWYAGRTGGSAAAGGGKR